MAERIQLSTNMATMNRILTIALAPCTTLHGITGLHTVSTLRGIVHGRTGTPSTGTIIIHTPMVTDTPATATVFERTNGNSAPREATICNGSLPPTSVVCANLMHRVGTGHRVWGVQGAAVCCVVVFGLGLNPNHDNRMHRSEQLPGAHASPLPGREGVASYARRRLARSICRRGVGAASQAAVVLEAVVAVAGAHAAAAVVVGLVVGVAHEAVVADNLFRLKDIHEKIPAKKY